MNRLLSFYNKNRYTIWMAILIIIAVISIVQTLNKSALQTNKTENTVNQTFEMAINKNYSVISGSNLKEEIPFVIDRFISFCNNGQIENAYALLSDECKEVLYPTLNDFKQNYYNRLFTEKRTYLYQAWINKANSYTYKVDFVDDMLATGKPSQKSISDYYTIVKKDNEYKLNINKFIGIKQLNATQKKDKITINIIEKKVYMDYEIFEIEVENKTRKQIILGDLLKTNAVYVENNKELRYYWYSHEIIKEDIIVRIGEKKKVQIKFNKEYQPRNESMKMVFSDIIIDEKKRTEIEILLNNN